MLKNSKFYILPGLVALILLSGCGAGNQSGGNQMSYDEMKTLVVDILKTKEGQKAIEEATSNASGAGSSGGLQMLSTQDQTQLKTLVKDTITDPSFEKTLNKIMTDPKFAGEFAKAINKSDKQLHKDLMKDPEYQKTMIELFKNPEFEKIITDSMKASAYRKQTMQIMQDAIKDPLFKLEFMKLIDKSVEKQLKPEEVKKSGGEGGEGGGESSS